MVTTISPADPWFDGLDVVRAAGFEICAMVTDADAEPIDRVPQPSRPALLLGAEGPGLTPAAVSRVDRRVRIPMAPGVDSLNLFVSAAIALHRLVQPS